MLLLYGFVIALEVPTLLKNRMFRELAVFSVFLALAVYLSLAQLYNWYLPNPFQGWIAQMASGQ
ncbi:MAG TPA: hypothetical protein VN426_15095 [Syntrophomonadaceae bacterium]|nr:hypothetical protein [Syntrophomonadaceae bacterium]